MLDADRRSVRGPGQDHRGNSGAPRGRRSGVWQSRAAQVSESGRVVMPLMNSFTRRSFLQRAGLGAAAFTLSHTAGSAEKPIQGFEKAADDPNVSKGWEPFS